MRFDKSKLKKITNLDLDKKNPRLHVFKVNSTLFGLYDDSLDLPLEYDSLKKVRDKIKLILKMYTGLDPMVQYYELIGDSYRWKMSVRASIY